MAPKNAARQTAATYATRFIHSPSPFWQGTSCEDYRPPAASTDGRNGCKPRRPRFYNLSQSFTTLYTLAPRHRASHLTDRWHRLHLQSLAGHAHGILEGVAPEVSLNWSWLTVRVAIAATLLLLLFLSQRFWYR